MPTQLSRAAFTELGRRAAVPRYAPEQLTAGILHFGVGNFHRAHQAVYLDALFNSGRDHDWAIVGAGVRAADAALRRLLLAQDWLTTVVEQEAGDASARVTAAMTDYLAVGDGAAIVNRLADPAIRIVSLTITEGGYYMDPATGRFDPRHPDILAEVGGRPRTVFGMILAGLQRRRDAGVAPFTVMSCDNIPGNGRVTRNAVAGLAEAIRPELASWVRSDVSFPDSMVDRITPATSDRERQLLAQEFDIADAWPVFCERYTQWVVEDAFPAGRPALEQVGVQFVEDVAPFELMKIRILNGGHAAIAYPAALMDIRFVHEAMAEPLVRGFLERVEREEILPVVPPVPGTDLDAYCRRVVSRFCNPRIGDTVQRLCFDGSNRQPKFILPSVADRLAQGAGVAGLALVSALWARYCYGETESGATIAANDPAWERLQLQARLARRRPAAWLEMTDIYGAVAGNAAFAGAFEAALEALWADGTRAVLERYQAGNA